MNFRVFPRLSGSLIALADASAVAQSFGYTAEQLAAVPIDSHMGLGCGNPTVTATLKPGEAVLDLGSGGGIDIFLAALKIGPGGIAIGLDMSAVRVTIFFQPVASD